MFYIRVKSKIMKDISCYCSKYVDHIVLEISNLRPKVSDLLFPHPLLLAWMVDERSFITIMRVGEIDHSISIFIPAHVSLIKRLKS